MDLQLLAISVFSFFAAMLMSLVAIRFARDAGRAYRKRYVLETGQQLQEMFLLFAPEQILVISVVSALLGGLIGFGLTGGWFLSAALALAGWSAPRIWLMMVRNRRFKRFEEQLMEALATLSNSMRAGFSLIQALEMCAREMNPPLSQEFGLLLREHRLGVNLDVALQNLATRIPSKNLDLVVTSILIARNTGGNLSEVFTAISDTMRNIRTIEGKIEALTAQGKLQGLVIGSLPIAMGYLMYQLDPELMGVLFVDPIGWGILGLIAFLEVLGGFFIWKIINIDI